MGEIKIVDGILLILALTTDSFVVSFAYGMAKTKMPFFMVAGMNLMMSSLLGAAVLTGNFFSSFLPDSLTCWVGILLLSFLGIYRMMSFFFRKETNSCAVKVLTMKEGFILAFVLSADSLAAGLGTGLFPKPTPQFPACLHHSHTAQESPCCQHPLSRLHKTSPQPGGQIYWYHELRLCGDKRTK